MSLRSSFVVARTALVRAGSLFLVTMMAATVAHAESDGSSSTTDPRYHGFAMSGIDPTRLDAEHPSLARQVALIEAAGLPAEVLAFFRTVPIRVERDLPRPPGEFVGGPRGGFVRVLPDGMAADRPILLHELIHAYHAGVVGLDDRTIDQAFAAARRSSDYPARFRSAHFLENAKEYFAVTSTIYLVGPVQQPPFDCSVLRATQPEYLAFLAAHFGPHDCR